MSSFANISVRINANLKAFSKQIDNASRDMQKIGKQMQNTGKSMSTYLTAPILALGYVSVEAFDKQAKAIAQVEAGIKSTGGAAGYTSEQLQKMASDLQNKTIFGDEAILQGATAQLLTFTNIAGNQFARTQEAALNLATRLDGDLKSASIQLGKALNDPVANLSALSRSGIQFSNDQKAVIKSLTESGRLADAQTIILDELEKQYGGAAEAAAKAGKGGLTQFYNILGDIAESFGEIVMEYLNPFVAKLKALALRFQDLDKSTKKIIVVIAAFAAAIGPVLLTLGFLMTTVIPGLIALLPALGTAFTALTGPIGLVVAAIAGIAYVVYNNWDAIMRHMVALQNYFIDLYNSSIVFRGAIEGIILVFKTLWNIVKLVFGSIWEIVKNVGKYILDTFKNVGAGIKAALTGNFDALPGIIGKQMDLMKSGFTDTFTDIGKEFDTFAGNMNTDVQDMLAKVNGEKLQNVVYESTQKGIEEATKTLNNITPVGTGGREKVGTVSTLTPGDVIQAKSPLDDVEAKMPYQVAFMSEQQERFLSNAMAFNEGLAEITQNTATNFVTGFAEILGGMASGTASLRDLGNFFLGTMADMAIQVGKLAISIGVATEAVKKALETLGGFGAIAAGIALVGLGTMLKNGMSNIAAGKGGGGVSVPKFADGGIVYGPTLGLMGEYSGARSNPEVIAPLSKLKDLIGGAGPSGPIQLKGVLKGRDIHLQNARTDDFLNRRR